MDRGPIHVVRSGDGWAVKKEGAARASSLHRTQQEAWRTGRELARAHETDVYLHGRDGRVQEREIYDHGLEKV